MKKPSRFFEQKPEVFADAPATERAKLEQARIGRIEDGRRYLGENRWQVVDQHEKQPGEEE